MLNASGTHKLVKCEEHDDCMILECIHPKFKGDPFYAPQHLEKKHHDSVTRWMGAKTPSMMVAV